MFPLEDPGCHAHLVQPLQFRVPPHRGWLPIPQAIRAPFIWDTDEFPAQGGAHNKESPQGVTENRGKSTEEFPALGEAHKKESHQGAEVNKQNQLKRKVQP